MTHHDTNDTQHTEDAEYSTDDGTIIQVHVFTAMSDTPLFYSICSQQHQHIILAIRNGMIVLAHFDNLKLGTANPDGFVDLIPMRETTLRQTPFWPAIQQQLHLNTPSLMAITHLDSAPSFYYFLCSNEDGEDSTALRTRAHDLICGGPGKSPPSETEENACANVEILAYSDGLERLTSSLLAHPGSPFHTND